MHTAKLAIIGGTGLTQLTHLQDIQHHTLDTPFGAPSAPYISGKLNGYALIFLARHGNPHTLLPHNINYRANIWGLKTLGVNKIIAVAAVGGITPLMQPAQLVVPDQIIDYSYGRQHTFFDQPDSNVTHIDFSYPYTPSLRQVLLKAAQQVQVSVVGQGTYGCTQGPRLETAAEIRRMRQDGCDLVGMTGMPEAALARELGLEYVTLAVVANWAAGIVEAEITMDEIVQHLHSGMDNVAKLLPAVLSQAN